MEAVIMSTQLSPPTGFDEASPQERIEYLQALWDRIAKDSSRVPVPDWHREVLKTRLEESRSNPDGAIPWTEARVQILAKLERPSEHA